MLSVCMIFYLLLDFSVKHTQVLTTAVNNHTKYEEIDCQSFCTEKRKLYHYRPAISILITTKPLTPIHTPIPNLLPSLSTAYPKPPPENDPDSLSQPSRLPAKIIFIHFSQTPLHKYISIWSIAMFYSLSAFFRL